MLAVLSSAEKEMIDIFKSNVDFTLLHNTLNFLWFRNNMFEGFGSIFRPSAHTSAVVHLNNLIRQLHCTAVHYYIQGEPECDIRMNFDTNKYPNIFVSKFWTTKIYLNIFVSRIFIRTDIQIYFSWKTSINFIRLHKYLS